MVKQKNILTLKNFSGVQAILAGYVESSSTKILNIETENDMPQTIIGDEENEETPISDLLHEKSKRCYYFLDKKKQTKYWRIMYDLTLSGPLPQTTNKNCWWCRSKFQTIPIGCPIKYNNHKDSSIEKERFEQKRKAKGVSVPDTGDTDFFETIGIFCSFPCCKAYILEQKNLGKYSESLTLLTLLFKKIFAGVEPDFPIAPSWKLLKEYGGHLTIQEFRQTFGIFEYVNTVNFRRHYMYNTSEYIEEKKIKLFKPNKNV